jgi:peptidylprolyl isomerase
MTSGLKIQEISIGSGLEAIPGKVVVVHFKGFLNRGEEILNTYAKNKPVHIELGKRQAIAGLELGIEGMKQGGKRELTVSPHLAYGKSGLPGSIPADAVIRFEVELLEVREPGVVKPEDFPPGKVISILKTGQTATSEARWQLGLNESGQAGISITKPPPSGATWRHMRAHEVPLSLSKPEIDSLIREIISFPQRFPGEVISPDDIGMDTSEKANSIPRHSKTDVACVSVTIWERGSYESFHLSEESPSLRDSQFYKLAMDAISKHSEKQ